MPEDATAAGRELRSDRDLVRRVIAETGRRARDEAPAGLAHPSAVDRKLHEHLARAQADAGFPVEGRAAALVERGLSAAVAAQRRYNESLVEIIHQLDHRTRAQEERIRHLEADVAALRARADRP